MDISIINKHRSDPFTKIPKRRIFMVDTRLCSKLNNTEAKLTRVPPHCFVIVIVKPWAWYSVTVLSLLY